MSKIISLVGTKGGIIKSTMVQCLSTSKAFEDYKIAILEGDSQGSLIDWISERDCDLPKLNIEIINHDKNKTLKEEIEKLTAKYDYIFLDLPGESEALTLTRSALAYSDLCLFPLRIYHKDINAFDRNMRPVIAEILKMRDKKHFKILGTFGHHSTDAEKYISNFDTIDFIDKLENIHYDRQVLTYFSVGGLTLREYLLSSRKDKIEFQKAKKAVDDMEKIAAEILKYLNI